MKRKETKSNEKNVRCPECGTDLRVEESQFTAVAAVTAPKPPAKPSMTAKERIEALRAAGMDVSHLFAMQGANGGEYLASNKDGKLAVLGDDDPLFKYIAEQGTVPNRRLFRRWVMAQMFHMLSHTDYRSQKSVGVTEMIHRLGYEYQWKMLAGELHAQMKMEGKDPVNFADRNRWFNAEMVAAMVNDYIAQLKKRVDGLQVKNCKGIPYKRIGGRDIFVSDLQVKLYDPLQLAMRRIASAKNTAQLYNAVKKFNEKRVKGAWGASQCTAWVNAYKGAGAFFTMQNLIRFHGCTVIDDAGKRLDKVQSLAFLSVKADMYCDGQGWRLFAVLKKMLDDNGIDIQKKMAEWCK